MNKRNENRKKKKKIVASLNFFYLSCTKVLVDYH